MTTPQGDAPPPSAIRLARARAQRGLSQAEVVRMLRAVSREVDGIDAGVDERAVRRWERDTVPGPRYRRLLCRLYDTAPEQLGFHTPPQQVSARQPEHETLLGTAVWTPEDAESLLARAEGTLTPTLVTRLAHEWLIVDPPQIIEPRAGRRIGNTLARHVERRVEQLRHMDDFVGGRDLYELVARELRATIELLDNAAYSSQLGRRLLVAVGELCQLAGWVATDAGLPAAAERHYVAGVRAAHAADDRALAGHAISSLAYHLANRGDPRTGVVLARSAYEGAKARCTPTTRALLLERVAWAHARAGDLAQTERALDAVDNEFERRQPEDDPLWVYWLDRDEIDVMAGRCYTELHQASKARSLLHRVLERYDDSRAREAALYTTWLAEDHIQTGDLDHAATAAIRALELAACVNSVRGDERVAQLHRALLPHGDIAQVREFDTQYRSLLASRPTTASA